MKRTDRFSSSTKRPLGSPWGWLPVLALLALLPARVARAVEYGPCETTPTEAEVAAAKGAFQAGSAAYNEADYDRAINYWEDAFRRDCTATALLLNLARAYESAGRIADAIQALDTYNQRNPDSPERAQIEKRIERLQEQQKEEQEAKAAEEEQQQEAAAAAPAKTQQVETSPEADNGGRSAVPLVIAGVGGVVAIAGGVLYFKALSDANDIENRCGGDRKLCSADLARKGQHKRDDARLFGWVGGAGLAVTAGGLLWYFLQPTGDDEQSAQREPGFDLGAGTRLDGGVGPGFAALQLSGEF